MEMPKSVVKSMQRFLSNLQSLSWKQKAKSTICKVVMGNQSCDLDSSVSAITYAHLLHSLDKDMSFGMVLPLLNIEKKDFSLRTEVCYWLKQYSITDDMLIFRDDIDLSALASGGNLQLYLIDHNILAPNDAYLEPFVVSVVDHHQLERTDTPVYGMTVEPVGSCATLIASEIISKNPESLNNDVAYLLYGTILVDTVNLSESAQRTTAKDIAMIEYLEKYLKLKETERSSVFEKIIEAKTDISQLDSEQIFRKDLKVVSENNISVAVASVPLLVRTYLLRSSIDDCLRDIQERYGYDIIVLMGIDVSGEVERDLAVISYRKTLRRELSEYLITGNSGLLRLENIPDVTNRDCNAFYQRNRAASRKIVLPLVKQWLNEFKI